MRRAYAARRINPSSGVCHIIANPVGDAYTAFLKVRTRKVRRVKREDGYDLRLIGTANFTVPASNSHMRPLALVSALVVAGVVAACQMPARTARSLQLVGGTIVDVIGQRPPSRADIVIDGSRIAEIITGDRHSVSNADTVDISGKFVIPGLCDMHVHLQPYAAPLLVAHGVTSVRDMGGT